jgi:hypothetical protein
MRAKEIMPKRGRIVRDETGDQEIPLIGPG